MSHRTNGSRPHEEDLATTRAREGKLKFVRLHAVVNHLLRLQSTLDSRGRCMLVRSCVCCFAAARRPLCVC